MFIIQWQCNSKDKINISAFRVGQEEHGWATLFLPCTHSLMVTMVAVVFGCVLCELCTENKEKV
jgi:hypothetical protein